MKSFSRADRVGVLIQRCLAEILSRGVIKDPRLDKAIITEVKMTRDIKSARVYYVVPSHQKDAALEGFKSAIGYIKRTLAEKLELRYMPALRFYFDESIDYGSYIDGLLKSVHREDGEDYTPR